MGMKILSGGSPHPSPPEPDPKRFEILELQEVQGWTVALVRYPGCTTYRGLKLMVYAVAPDRVRGQFELDPHFLEGEDALSPVARFPPTEEGRRLAEWTCRCPREGS